MLRKTAFTLAVLTILLQISACGNKEPDVSEVKTYSDASSDISDAEAEGSDWTRTVAREDYEGKTFSILVETNANTPIWERYWVSEEDSGDILSSAVYSRNRTISEYYNIDLQYPMTSDIGNKFYNSVIAGEYAYNLAVFHLASASGYVTKGAYYNWFDIPNVDFENPWWSPSNVDDLAYENVLFTAIGDCAVSSLATTYCMFYNKNKAEDYGITDVYGIVRDGEWTIDKLKSLTKDIYSDLNNNATADSEDLYGFVTPPATALIAYNWALGGHIFQKNSAGELVNVYMSEHTVKMFEQVYSMLYESAGSYTSRKYSSPYGDAYHSMGRDYLLNGQAVFINGMFDDALTHFRSMEDDYGIIPYPKLDEDQDAYHTTCNANLEAMTIPANTPDDKLGMVGLISEALCAESYTTVIPAYYQVSLKDKSARDSETLEMLDLIRSSRCFDFGYLYNFGASSTYYASFMEELMNPDSPNKDVASLYAQKQASYDADFQKIFDYYDEYISSHN